MADADGNIIPIVEDDQGEGYKDIWEQYLITNELISKNIMDQFMLSPELLGKRDRKDEKTEYQWR